MILGLNTDRGKRLFSSPNHPDWFWDPPSLLFNGYLGSSPGDKATMA